MPKELMYNLPDEITRRTHIIDLATEFNPLAPFCDILLHCKPTKEAIHQHAYSVQEPTLQSFFANGIADERYDLIICNEIDYEKHRMQATLLELMRQFCTEYFLILNAHLMSKGAIEFLSKLVCTEFPGKIIFCFDSERIETAESFLDNFYQTIENHKNFFDITEYEADEPHSHEQKDVPPLTFDTIFRPLHNCRLMVTPTQGVSLCRRFEPLLQSIPLTKDELHRIYFEIALLYYYSHNYDNVPYYLDKITREQNDDELTILSLICYSCVLQAKNVFDIAHKYIKLVEQKLDNDKNSPFYALAYMNDYIITQKIYRKDSEKKYRKALELLTAHGFLNNYVTTALCIPWHIMTDTPRLSKVLPTIESAMTVAEQLGNEYGLSTACNWKGIILLHTGKRTEASFWYNKCNELRTKIDDLPAIIKIRNGISYEFLIATKYKESYDLLNDFSDRIMDLHENTEIIITLNNIANTLFYSCHFAKAFEFYQKILHLLYIFNFEKHNNTTFLPEYNDIMLHNIYINLYEGNINRAKIGLHNVQNNGRPTTLINEPIKLIIEAILALDAENLTESQRLVAEAEASFSKFSSAQAFRHVFILYEYCLFLNRHGHSELCQTYLEHAKAIIREYNFVYFLDGDRPITPQEYAAKVIPFDEPKIDLRGLEEKIRKEQMITQMHKQLRASKFLNKVMLLSSDTQNEQAYASNIIHALIDYTGADAASIHSFDGIHWQELGEFSKISQSDISDETLSALIKTTAANRDSIRLSFNKKHSLFVSNLSKFKYQGLLILVPGAETDLTNDDIETLNIALSNIQAQLVMKNQQEHLRFISSVDQLSMLQNRRALQERLSVESEMVRRYLVKRNKHFQMSISFIDLDNFKYINDTFGHEAGDFIIMRFAALLTDVYRKVDFVARFGGDEFVILLPNTDCAEACLAAERLKAALQKQEYFVPALEEHLGKKHGACAE